MSEAVSESADGLDGRLNIQSFIVRMWLEEVDEKTHREVWRGRITHIPGDEQRYFTDVNEITIFIKSHLNRKGETDTS